MEQKCCSNCGAVHILSKKETELGYGAVIKKCPYCGNFYYEDWIKEISVQGMKKSDKFIIRPNVFLFSVLSIIIGIAITAILVYAIVEGARIRIVAFLGPIWILGGFFQLFKELITYLKRLSDLKKESKESYNRLNDPVYRSLLFLVLPPNESVKYGKNNNYKSNGKFDIKNDSNKY